MGDWNISSPSASGELTSGQALVMVSRHKIKEMVKSVTDLVHLTKSMKIQDKMIWRMEESLTHLGEELRLLMVSSANPSQPETRMIPDSPVYEAVNPYPIMPMEGENASMNCPICLSSLYCMPMEWGHASMTCPICLSSLSSMPMEGEHASTTCSCCICKGEDRSVFLVGSFTEGECKNAIYEVKFKGEDMGREGVKLPPLKPLATFSDGCLIRTARIFSRHNLFIFLPEDMFKGIDASSAKSPCGHIFDMETRLLHRSTIPQPKSFKPTGFVISAFEKIYYISSPSCFHPFPKLSFEKYDPDEKTWVSMSPFPFFDGNCMDIKGYAVCYGVILFSLAYKSVDFDFVAFHETRKGKEWNKVKFDPRDNAPFSGRAVVVRDTIYALHMDAHNVVLALSFSVDEGDDGDTTYSLSKLCVLYSLVSVHPPWPFCDVFSDDLVHLGNHEFFHVKTCRCDEVLGVQYVCFTMFEIVVGEGGHMIKTLHSTVFPLDITDDNWFWLDYCFTPDCGDYEPVQRKCVTGMKQPKPAEETIQLRTAQKGAKQEIAGMKEEVDPMQHEKANQEKPKIDPCFWLDYCFTPECGDFGHIQKEEEEEEETTRLSIAEKEAKQEIAGRKEEAAAPGQLEKGNQKKPKNDGKPEKGKKEKRKCKDGVKKQAEQEIAGRKEEVAAPMQLEKGNQKKPKNDGKPEKREKGKKKKQSWS